MRTEWLNVNIVMHTKDRFVSMQKSQLGLVAGENLIVFMGVCGGGLKSEKVSLKQAAL